MRLREAVTQMKEKRTNRLGLAGVLAILSAVFLAIAAFGPESKASQSQGKQSLALSAKMEIERSKILKGTTRPIYVLVRFIAPDLDVSFSRRPPLNLTLVLDRSGSMADKGKIEYLKTAAKMAATSLGMSDAISIVEFDDTITTMLAASRPDDKPRIAGMIDALTPRGSTNIAGGLRQGIVESQKAGDELHLARDTINRVILLSDGLTNTGITDHGAIARIAADGREKDIRISAMGLGIDYDEDLMQAIAESGGGKYYYIESPTQLSRIFEEELKTAFSTRARDVHLAFSGSALVRHAELVGFADASGPNVSADWPDFYAGEERSVLLKLDVDARSEGSADLGHFRIAWRDAQSGISGSYDMPVHADVTADEATSEASVNKDVAVEAALAESERDLSQNVKLYEQGKTVEANRRNAALINSLKARNATLKDERIARKIEAMNVEQDQMTAAEAAPQARAGFLKASKQRLYQAKSGQRSGYLLQPGDKGYQVELLQRSLTKEGFYKGPVNGVYDKPTAAAVKAYQMKNAIPADGVAGATTQQALGLY